MRTERLSPRRYRLGNETLSAPSAIGIDLNEYGARFFQQVHARQQTTFFPASQNETILSCAMETSVNHFIDRNPVAWHDKSRRA
jgi:hypothetical protein